MQTFPEAPNEKWSDVCPEKTLSLWKGEIRTHFNVTPRTKGMQIHAAAGSEHLAVLV